MSIATVNLTGSPFFLNFFCTSPSLTLIPFHFCSHYPHKFKCHQMDHSVMSSGELACDMFSSLSVTLHLSHLGSAQVQLKKEGNRKSILFLQTNIHICTIITWLQLAGKHLQSHIPITCPLAPHLSEQLSRGAATQVDPGEELQVPGSKWGKQLGSAAQPPRTQTPPCCSRLSRGENQ